MHSYISIALMKLSKELHNQNLITYAQKIKALTESIYLYSYIPTDAQDTVMEYGLASSNYIKNNPELLKKIFPKNNEKRKWLQRFKDEENDITLKGPSVWLSKPNLNKILKMDPNHPLSEDKFTLVEINYSKLKEDYPETQIYGLELIPYENKDYKNKKKEIEHELNQEEILNLSKLSFEETWKDYLKGEGYFSPNVPHGVVLTNNGVILPQYLKIIS